MKRSILSVALLTALASAGFAVGQSQPTSTSAPSATPPAKTVARWDEDYSYLKDPAASTDIWDPIKYIPLNQNGDVYASFGGQVRDRFEYFNFNTFGVGPQTKPGYNLTRLTVNADLHVGPNVRFFVQGASAFEDDRETGPRPPDRDEVDLEQAFADIRIPLVDKMAFTFRGGRQYLAFGAERLIGPADWLNARRTFDGFRGTFTMPGNSLDLFIFRPVLIEPYTFDSSDDLNNFAGIYDTLQLNECMPEAHSKLETYLLYLDRRNVTFAGRGGQGTEDVYTIGARLSSNPQPFDIDVEFDYQTGDFKGQDVNAYSFATKEGYTIAGAPLKPRLFIGGDIASGGSGHGQIQTFNQLFPTPHGQFGNIDAIGRQNIVDINPGIDLTLLEHQPMVDALTLRSSFYEFWRQNVSDAVYAASGTVLRASGASTAAYIGNELDFQLNWKCDSHFAAYAGYAHFFPGEFIQQTGPSKSIDFAYAAFSYTF